ncbi:MAG TPA: RIP metalloprotease RseP [Candidatus Kapabacteria bacterium]|nr:RIP metalloprotease RseP [Candidatus Kapabacteria bacterium]
MELFFNIIYFIIAIGVLVAIHELGHFLAARWTGMRAEVFSIGMGKRLFGWNKINGLTFGNLDESIELGNHTDYRLAAFPIGGYVKISGMIDESFDTNFTASEPQEWEFRAKNSLQKAFVLSAGVIMNFLLAIVVFACISFINGSSELSTTEIYKVETQSLAAKAGFQSGDIVKKINNTDINSWNSFIEQLTLKELGNELNIEVLRNNKIEVLTVNGASIIKGIAKKENLGLLPGGIKTVVDEVVKGNPADKAGIQAGDTIIQCNDIPISSVNALQTTLKDYKGKEIVLSWNRNGKIMTHTLTTTESGLIGVRLSYAPLKLIEYGFFESIGIGFKETIGATELLIKSISQIFKGNLSFKESVAGPLMIMDMAGEQANRGLISFLSFIALLSISLAFMNILPFPALDGGHLVFVLIEGIIRKELPVKVKLAFQQGGIVILLLFMAFVFYNDIVRMLK